MGYDQQSLVSLLKSKKAVDIPFQSVLKEFNREMLRIVDLVSNSRSAAARDYALTPEKIKWAIVLDQAEEPDERYLSYEELLRYFTSRSKSYLKAIVGGGRGGKLILYELLERIPKHHLAILEQRARFMTEHAQEPEVEEPTDIEPPPFRSNGQSLVSVLDSWFESHKGANRRVYFVAREAVKQLMESADEKR